MLVWASVSMRGVSLWSVRGCIDCAVCGLCCESSNGSFDVNVLSGITVLVRHAGHGIFGFFGSSCLLRGQDMLGSCDPFCVVKLRKQEFKTSVIKKTYEPWWEETHAFGTREAERPGGDLSVEVWDWDRVGTNDFVGRATLEAGEVETLVGGGAEGEVVKRLVDEGGQEVKGEDGQPAEVVLRLRGAGVPPAEALAVPDLRRMGSSAGAIAYPCSLSVTVVGAKHLPKMVSGSRCGSGFVVGCAAYGRLRVPFGCGMYALNTALRRWRGPRKRVQVR